MVTDDLIGPMISAAMSVRLPGNCRSGNWVWEKSVWSVAKVAALARKPVDQYKVSVYKNETQ